jgi:3-oxoacyl-[acyl-carrier-protein] synthase II
MTAAPRRALITGIGLLTGLGEGPRRTWDALLDGRTAIKRLTAYDPTPLRTQIGAEIHGFDPLQFTARKALRMLNRGDQLGLAGATLAIEDAGSSATAPACSWEATRKSPGSTT